MAHIFRKSGILSVCLAVITCSSLRHSYNEEELFRGIRIPTGEKSRGVREALEFISAKEPGIFFFITKAVSKIDMSLYYGVSHPYYDTIYLAEFALSRGPVYAASVIVHELHHISCNRIRRKKGDEDTKWMNEYLAQHELTKAMAEKMSRRAEEKTAFSIQLKFLLHHGSEDDIEYQRLRMESFNKKEMR